MFRIALKIATGSGKTVVMAMLIAWQALNKFANTQDARSRLDPAHLHRRLQQHQRLWIPAINNHGGVGRWAHLEVIDPWDAQNTIHAFVQGQNVDGVALMFR